jgi:Flp pilus assembly pilin Flp
MLSMMRRPSRRRHGLADSRGGNLVEYILLAGIVALCAIAAWRTFNKSVQAIIGRQAVSVATLQAAPGQGANGVTRGPGGRISLPIVDNPKCFAAGTPVKTAEGDKPIEKVREGDLVWSRDEVTGALQLEAVLQTFVTPGQSLVELLVTTRAGTTEHLRVTPGHRFWVEGRGWQPAEILSAGDEVRSSDGALLELRGTTSLAERATVYNLEVQDFHTYFVGQSALWVHNPTDPNACPGASGGAAQGSLDSRFGAPQPPGGRTGIKPFERDANGNVIKNPTLQTVEPGKPPVLVPGKEYIWAVTKDGKLVIGEEVPTGNKLPNGRDEKLGHPTLVDGQEARIGGELRWTPDGWVINNASGRYSGHPDRGPEQLDNAADLFREAGVPVKTNYLNRE